MPLDYKLARAFIVFVFLCLGSKVQAKEITIFDVRKSLPLSDAEVVYRDFYINAGTEKGLSPGLVVNVTRRTSLYDAYQNRSPGELTVPVGQVEIIHVQKGLSVARETAVFSRENLPLLDYEHIMIGDFLDMSSAKRVKSKDQKLKKAVTNQDQRQAKRQPTAAIVNINQL